MCALNCLESPQGACVIVCMTAPACQLALAQVGLGLSDGQCVPPASPQPGMGSCDQFGAQCRTWECPDYFELDGAHVIKWSDQACAVLP